MGSYITHRPLVHQLLPDSISCVRQLCVIKIQIQIQIQIQKQTQNTSHPGLNCTSAAPQVHIQNTNYKYKHKYIMRRAVVHQLVVESLSHVCGRRVSSYTMAMQTMLCCTIVMYTVQAYVQFMVSGNRVIIRSILHMYELYRCIIM